MSLDALGVVLEHVGLQRASELAGAVMELIDRALGEHGARVRKRPRHLPEHRPVDLLQRLVAPVVGHDDVQGDVMLG